MASDNDDDKDDDDGNDKDAEVVEISTGEAITMLDRLVNSYQWLFYAWRSPYFM